MIRGKRAFRPLDGHQSRGRNAPGRPETVAARLLQLECDPIAGMAKLAQDETVPPVLRARMFAELAHYVAPRARAVDLTDCRMPSTGSDTPAAAACAASRATMSASTASTTASNNATLSANWW